MHSEDGWLSIREAANVAGVQPQSVHKWIERGRLQAHPSDHGLRIAAADLARFMAARHAAAAAGKRVDTVLRSTDREPDEAAR